jgi:ABC-type multidrug transport system fused ATPase/permease subunit
MIDAARRSLGYLSRRERIVYFSFVGGRALLGLLDVVGILLIGLIASIGASQFGAGAGKPVTVAGIELPTFDEAGLLGLVIVVLLVFVGKAFIAVLLTRRMVHFIARVETAAAASIADLILNGSLDSVKAYSKAQLQYAMTTSTAGLFTGILNSTAVIVAEGFLLIVVVGSFFFVNPIAAAFTLVFFGVIIIIIQFVIGGTISRAGRDSARGMVDTTNSVSDSMDSFREISVLGKQSAFLHKIVDARGRVARAGATFRFLAGLPRYVVETALIFGVVVFVGQQFLAGELATGIVTIGVFLTGGVRVIASLLPLQAAVAGIATNRQEAVLASELLDRERALAATRAAAPPPAPGSPDDLTAPLGVEIASATFRYPGDVTDTLHDIDLTIDPGTFVAIIGPSGAGKTTLVDLILGLVPPASGDIAIGGLPPLELRAGAPGLVSYVPQRPGMVSGTIAENIALGVQPDDIDRALLDEVIASAYLTDFLATLPEGVDTSVGAQVDALSGGQIQRIGLARALYSRPRLLILDEATSGLDAGSEAFISKSLRAIHGKVTVVVIAHRLSTVQHADVVHVLQAGRVVASGGFAALRKTVPMVEEYVKLMSFEDDSPPPAA